MTVYESDPLSAISERRPHIRNPAGWLNSPCDWDVSDIRNFSFLGGLTKQGLVRTLCDLVHASKSPISCNTTSK